MTINEMFADMTAARKDTDEVGFAEQERDEFDKMGLQFKNRKPPQGYSWADDSEENAEDAEEEYKEFCEVRDSVLEDTEGAESIACSGLTTVNAATTFAKKLMFKCGLCQAMFLLNHLMPTDIDGTLHDYCWECFSKAKGKISKKKFKLAVCLQSWL